MKSFGLFYRSRQLDAIRQERGSPPHYLVTPTGELIQYSEFSGKFPYRPGKLWDDAKLVAVGVFDDELVAINTNLMV